MRDVGELTVVSPQFITSLVLLAASGWWWLWRARRRARSARAAYARYRLVWVAVVSVLLSITAVASGVNAYFSYLPKVRDVADVVVANRPPDAADALTHPKPAERSRGQLVRLAVPDNGSGFGRSAALAWLPPQYFTDPTRRFVVAYLFHGSPGVSKDWFRGGEADRIGLALAEKGYPAILVAPQMSHSWLDDPECVDGAHEKIETHLIRDVLPTVDRMLRTMPGRDGRIFAGMSAGGYCALNLGLRNRDLAASVLDLSGLTMPTHAGGLSPVFGRRGSVLAPANSPSLYAASLPIGLTSRIWLDSGSSDHQVLRQMRSIAPVLRSRGMVVAEKVRPGVHTFAVWRPALRDSLGWALRELSATVPLTHFGRAAD